MTTTPLNLYEYISQRLQRYVDRTAVVTAGSRLTYADVLTRAHQLRETLSDLGIRPRQVVGLALPNIAEFVPVFLGLCALDATVALISSKYKSQELEAIVEHVGPSWILASQADTDSLSQSLKDACVETRALHGFDGITALRIAPPAHLLQSDSLALLKFTSGSTGRPKGVGLTVNNVIAEAESVVETLGMTHDDSILALVPLTHSYGFDLGVLASLFSGATLHIGSGFVPRLTLRYITTEGISVFLGVPPMYRALIETRLSDMPDLSAVRYLLSCTAPLSKATISEFYDRFGAVICQHYGSSETGAAANHIPADVLDRADSVGRPMKGVTIRIVGEDGLSKPAGTVGEVVISGPAVAPRYVMGNPDERNPLQNGSYRTGELGILDDDGYLILKGRIDQLINVGGLKVGPDEVTQVLERHPSVREAAVVGALDKAGEEFVYAAVTLRGKADETSLIEFCRQYLAEYKVPRRIDVRDQLPRGATGKIQLKAEDVTL